MAMMSPVPKRHVVLDRNRRQSGGRAGAARAVRHDLALESECICERLVALARFGCGAVDVRAGIQLHRGGGTDRLAGPDIRRRTRARQREEAAIAGRGILTAKSRHCPKAKKPAPTGGPSSDCQLGQRDILERAKGLEPSTPTLARSCSTTELHPHPKWRRSLAGNGRPMPNAVCECNTRARSEPHEIARFP